MLPLVKQQIKNIRCSVAVSGQGCEADELQPRQQGNLVFRAQYPSTIIRQLSKEFGRPPRVTRTTSELCDEVTGSKRSRIG